jgi:23S rRNA (cytosine1962-C5)-methyltransferase
MKNSHILITLPSTDYALLDSGDGEKLERIGTIVLSRPDPQSLWAKKLPPENWKAADGHFLREEKGGGWSLKPTVPAKWEISFGGLKLWVKPTAFKHIGFFPEQSVNWEWMREKIETRDRRQEMGKNQRKSPLSTLPGHSPIEVLNLFGYTGGATLACAQAGASVVHIDSSKAAITWARENAELSGLSDKPIRWIIEDARVFVEREIKRGRTYDAIIMDPPAFGHGPTSELWKIEEHFLSLVENCKKLLKPDPLFFLINGYSAGYSAIAYENILREVKEKFGGEIEIGELVIGEELKDSERNDSKIQGQEYSGRLLPAGIFARWAGK